MALLTVRAAADRMGIGYSTLKQWIYQGKIRTTTTAGGHHRMSEAEIERLLARETSAAARAIACPQATSRTNRRAERAESASRLRRRGPHGRIDGTGAPADWRSDPDGRGHERRAHRAQAPQGRRRPGDHQVHRGHDRARNRTGRARGGAPPASAAARKTLSGRETDVALHRSAIRALRSHHGRRPTRLPRRRTFRDCRHVGRGSFDGATCRVLPRQEPSDRSRRAAVSP